MSGQLDLLGCCKLLQLWRNHTATAQIDLKAIKHLINYDNDCVNKRDNCT